MKLRRLPPACLKLAIRGVDIDGNGIPPVAVTGSDVSVIVDGVRAFKVGDGGKTNNV